ncbi:MAG TPA: cyclic nucleotide-binding domain-containing protein [Polyangia bacterium]|nr:cyclic nucleotide-binding domain-containing protein [Polyangia bacterium]
MTGGADTLVQLFTAQAELSRDPSDLSAWHEVAVGLAAAGDAAAGARALAELGQAAADAGLLPLALLAAKELELLDDPASRKLVADLARLYGAGSSRVDPKSRPRPPALPASASARGPTPPPVPADALPGRDEVLEAARRVAVATAARARRERTRAPVPAYPLFSSLPQEAFIALLGLLRPRTLSAGEVVFREGQPGGSIFIVARGTIEIARGRHTLAHLRSGTFFGEMALLTAQPRTATATATVPAVLFEVERAGLEALAQKEPLVGTVLAEHCRRRLLENLVASSPLFRAVPPSERGAVIARFRMLTSEPGQELLREGTQGEGLHVIVSGRVDVHKRDGAEVLQLSSLVPGEVFGEISLVRDRPVSATVSASERTVTLFLPRAEFEELAGTYPALVGAVYALVTEREKTLDAALQAPAEPADDFLV